MPWEADLDRARRIRNASSSSACRLMKTLKSERGKGRLAEPPPVAASVNHSIPADHRPDQMDNAQRHRMAPGRAAAAEARPRKRRNIPGGQCRPGAPGTL